MKLEKINDNQIRCTLTGEDLALRQIRLSELAYGSAKAKSLFRDMMMEADARFGFRADNIPLMIEAIPLGSDSIVLQITKVEDPEELDARFARFAPQRKDPETRIEDADGILNLIKQLYESKLAAARPKSEDSASEGKPKTAMPKKAARGVEHTPAETVSPEVENLDFVRMYRFRTLDDLIGASSVLGSYYHGENTLFHDKAEHPYLLIVHKGDHTPEAFNKVCNILSEYGRSVPCSPVSEAHYAEHGSPVLSGTALAQLASLAR